MKKILCSAIANTPDQIVSTDSTSRLMTERLVLEAESVKDLLWVLMMRYNSAVEPQASVYDRVNRLREKAIKRYNRRKVDAAIEMYRDWGCTADQVLKSSIFYDEVVSALRADEALQTT